MRTIDNLIQRAQDRIHELKSPTTRYVDPELLPEFRQVVQAESAALRGRHGIRKDLLPLVTGFHRLWPSEDGSETVIKPRFGHAAQVEEMRQLNESVHPISLPTVDVDRFSRRSKRRGSF